MGPDALHVLWRRLAPDTSPRAALESLCGVPGDSVADLATVVGAASPEAERLVATTPAILHRLRTTMSTTPERCVGHVQGPVMWAETLNARANMFGAEDIFVCGVQREDHDVAENRVLLAALDQVVRAAPLLGSEVVAACPDRLREQAAEHVSAARFLRNDPHLAGVRRRKTTPATLQRTRLSRRGRDYEPAVRMLERRSHPLRPDDLALVTDRRTAGQLRALLLVDDALRRSGHEPGPWQCVGGEIRAEGLRYRNWRRAGAGGSHGVLVGSMLVDGTAGDDPDERIRVLDQLTERAGMRRFSLVSSAEEADLAVGMELASIR